MKPRITVITIGVDDLELSLAFYRDGLGLKTEGIIGKEFDYGAVAFFDLQSGLKLALWPRKSLAHDSGLPLAPASATELSIGHRTRSGAVMPVTFRIPTAICGKWCGIRSGRLRIDGGAAWKTPDLRHSATA
jgi:catechol 2,3-dioxygenase-like lactoylglutathione lyase family enzyme